jgi:transposase InsO family protein
MSTKAHNRAMESYRARLTQRGLKRFEVLAPETDRELIRSLARLLAEDGPNAEQTRQRVKALVSGEPARPGSILSALRRSPLVGADLDLSRPREKGRRVDL